MLKRLIIVLVTISCVLVALFAYHIFSPDIETESSPTEEVDLPPEPFAEPGEKVDTQQFVQVEEVSIDEIKGLHLKDRDINGNLTREFSFTERLRSEGGVFIVSEPWTKFYLRDDGLIIEARSDRGGIPIETTAGQFRYPDKGFLEGTVRIYMYPLTEADLPLESRTLELVVELDQIVFEREMSRLVCDGPFHAKADQFEIEGSNLSLIYDQLNERLQEFELRKLEYLVVDQTALESLEKPSEDTAAVKTVAKESKAKSDKKIVPYRFTMLDDVRVDLGTEKILADVLEIVTMMDYSGQMKKDTTKTTAEDSDQNIEAITNAGESKPPAKITCNGPLRIAVAEDVQETGMTDKVTVRLEGQPAQILRDDEPAIEADVMVYDKSLEQFTLDTREDRPIRINLSEEFWATAQREVRLELNRGTATLTGPGRVEYAGKETDKPVEIEYQDLMKIRFTPQAKLDYRDTSLTNLQVKELEFEGNLIVNHEEGELSAGQGLLTFFETDPSSKTIADPNRNTFPPIRSIQLSKNLRARSKDQNFSAENLTAQFIRSSDGKSLLDNLVATGSVSFEDPNYLLEASEKITLIFDTETPVTQTESDTQQKTQLGLDQLLQSNKPISASADGAGGKVHLTDKAKNYRIIGDHVEMDVPNEICTVKGSKAKIIDLKKQSTLEGKLIVADIKKGFCQMPGQGNLDALAPNELLGSQSDKPLPFHVVWQDGAIYDLKNGEISIKTVTADSEIMEGDRRVESRIICPQMRINLIVEDEEVKDLNTFVAEGPVVSLINNEYDLTTNQLLRSLEMESRQLEFDKATQSLLAYGQGWIVVKDNQAVENTNPSTADPKDPLANLFTSRGPSYTLVQFADQMQLIPDKNYLQFTGGIYLDHLPLPLPENFELTEKTIQQIEGVIRLNCQILSIAMASGTDEPNTEPANLDMGRLNQFHAAGRVFMEYVEKKGTSHTFTCEKMDFNREEDTLRLTGSESLPVRFDQMQFLQLIYHPTTGQYHGTPFGQSEFAGQ